MHFFPLYSHAWRAYKTSNNFITGGELRVMLEKTILPLKKKKGKGREDDR